MSEPKTHSKYFSTYHAGGTRRSMRWPFIARVKNYYFIF